uniref:Uncharacterized protein n=1 Tax=Oryza punctata TaxID=4537 RepID=A0A0E0JEI1_ORYPU
MNDLLSPHLGQPSISFFPVVADGQVRLLLPDAAVTDADAEHRRHAYHSGEIAPAVYVAPAPAKSRR